jgi:hypothetical protein
MQSQRIPAAVTFIVLGLTFLVGNASLANEQLTKAHVFISGTGGYHTYRISAAP